MVMMMKRAGRKGMTLIEVLGYVAVIAVVINLATSVFIRSSRLAAMGTGALDTVNAVEEIRDEFTAAVRRSSGISARIGEHRSGSDRLVLTMPQLAGEEGVRRYVVFGRLSSDPRLSKLVVVERDGSLSAERFVTYRQDLDSIRFRYDMEDLREAKLVVMEIKTKRTVDRGKRQAPYGFTAAMRAVADSRGDRS